jgi:hypothetical protein
LGLRGGSGRPLVNCIGAGPAALEDETKHDGFWVIARKAATTCGFQWAILRFHGCHGLIFGLAQNIRRTQKGMILINKTKSWGRWATLGLGLTAMLQRVPVIVVHSRHA